MSPEIKPVSRNCGYRLRIRGKKVSKTFLNTKIIAPFTKVSEYKFSINFLFFLKTVARAVELQDTHGISIAKNNQQTFAGQSRFYLLSGWQIWSKFNPVSLLEKDALSSLFFLLLKGGILDQNIVCIMNLTN